MEYLESRKNNMPLKQQLTQFVRSKGFLMLAAFFGVLILLPIFVRDNFLLTVLTLVTIFAIYASSWNFLANSGQGSLGHAVFLGIGGFAAAIIGSSMAMAAFGLLGVSVGFASVAIQVLALLIGGLLSAGVGLLIGLACVRLKAWYLAMVTFGFSVIAATLSSQFDSFTQGINGFATTTLVPKGFPFYVLVVVFALASISIMYFITRSRTGLAFRAIHGNEAEAKMIGINTAKYKLYAFVISTFFAGIAGGLYAYFIRLVDNSIFSPVNSFTPLIMAVIGGLGTVAGPIIGAVFFVSIQQILSLSSVSDFLRTSLGPSFPNVGDVGPPLIYLVIGVILVVIVIFAPKGLVSVFQKAYKYFGSEPEKKEAKKP
jgi:branched-chain amino acid transport system permease protein